MKVWIEHPVEPSRLFLAWQAPEGEENRLRWAVGVLESEGATLSFRYFDEDEIRLRNSGRDLTQLRSAGFVGYPAFPFTPGAKFTSDILSTFLRRLPPPSRSDFGSYQEYFSIPPGTPVSGLTLLALTEARLPGDGFSLIDPFDPAVEVCDAVFEIAGFRYQAPHRSLTEGCRLALLGEATNRHDPDAVAVYAGDARIGYVNRLQAKTVAGWMVNRDLACELLRMNGRPGAPRAYGKLTVRPKTRVIAA